MWEVARFELQVDAGVTAEQLVQQTLRVLHDESELALQDAARKAEAANARQRDELDQASKAWDDAEKNLQVHMLAAPLPLTRARTESTNPVALAGP